MQKLQDYKVKKKSKTHLITYTTKAHDIYECQCKSTLIIPIFILILHLQPHMLP